MARRLALLALVASLAALVVWMAAPDDPIPPGRPGDPEPLAPETRSTGLEAGPRTAIHVLVVDEWGAPIPGAAVTVFAGRAELAEPWPSVLDRLDEEPRFLFAARTGSEGRATVEGPSGRPLLVRARADGRSPGLGPWEGEAISPEDPVRITLLPDCALEGRVTDVDGRPVPGVLVAAFVSGVFASYEMLPHLPRAVSGEGGRYRITGLPATTVPISAARPGATLRGVAVVRLPEVARFDIVLPPAAVLEGRITAVETGEPVGGATVLASIGNGFDSQRQTFRATTGADGQYAVPGLPPVRLMRVDLVKDGLVQIEWGDDEDITLVEGRPTRLDLRMRTATALTGAVRGPDGPIEGVEVRSGDAHAVTSEDGGFRLSPVTPGGLEVSAEATGFQPTTVEAKAPGPAEIVLARGATIEGIVRDADGGPVPGAKVFATYWRHFEEVKTDAEGRFSLRGVPETGVAAIQVYADGFREARRDDVGLPAEPIEISLERPREIVVRGTVRVTRGAMPGRCVVVVTDHHGSFDLGLDEPLSFRLWPGAPVGEDGRFEARFSPEEKGVEVRAIAPGFAPMVPVVIRVDPERNDYEADLVLDPGHAVEAVVVDATTGEPVPGAAVVVAVPGEGGTHVDWMDGPPAPTVHAVTSAAGWVRVDHVPAGRYVLGVTALGYVPARGEIRVPRDRPSEVQLEDMVVLAGTLRFEDGSNPGVVQLEIEPEGGGRGRLIYSRADGSFHCRGLARGRYSVVVDHDFDHPVNILSEEVGPLEAGRHYRRVTVRRGLTIQGAVVGPRGEPVAGATIDAEDLEGDGVGAWRHSGEDGSFEVVGLPAGRVRLEVEARGYVPTRTEEIEAGATGVRIELSRGGLVSGVLVDEAGEPLAGYWIAAVEPENEGYIQFEDPRAKTDAQGRFEISGIVEPVVELALPKEWSKPEYVLLGVAEVKTGATGLTVVASSGKKITGRVVDAKGRPVEGVHVRTEESIYGEGRYDRTDDDGRFVLERLFPGRTYTLELEWEVPGEGEKCVSGFEFEAGAKDVEIRLDD